MSLAVGRMVHVASRTWPGINEPGGVGRIIAVHSSASCNDPRETTHVDVHYMVLRRKEKRVPIQYVTLAPEYEKFEESNDRLRDRNRLKGRCSRCGSLRIDCGSCDWLDEMGQQVERRNSSRATEEPVEEEHEENSTDDEKLQNQLQKTYKKFRSLHQKWGRRRLFRKNDITDDSDIEKENKISHSPPDSRLSAVDEEDDYDDDDTDDDALLNAIARSNSKYSRLRARWHRFGDRDKQGFNHSTQVLQSPASDDGIKQGLIGSPDSASDDDIAIADLAQRPGHKLSNEQASSKRRQSTSVLSVFESVLFRNKKLRLQVSGGTSKRSTALMDNEEEQPRNNDEQSHSTTANVTGSAPLCKVGFVDDVGEVESNPDNNSINDGSDSAFDNEDPDSQPMTIDPNSDFLTCFGAGVSDELLPLGDFIQPEGEEAVQNLPTDTIDLSRNIAFTSLPDFFDRLVAKIEDEILPDAKLEFAYFEKEMADADDSAEIKEGKCLRDRLLRDGTDQCRLVLRRLDNAKLYRLHCKDLPSGDKKQFRGIAMDMRDLRLAEIDEAVALLMKTAFDFLQMHRSDSKNESGGESDGSFCGSYAFAGEYDTQELFERTGCALAGERVVASEPLFDPHGNAKRVRKRQTLPLASNKSKRGRQQIKRLRRVLRDEARGSDTSPIGQERQERQRRHLEDGSHQSALDEGEQMMNEIMEPEEQYFHAERHKPASKRMRKANNASTGKAQSDQLADSRRAKRGHRSDIGVQFITSNGMARLERSSTTNSTEATSQSPLLAKVDRLQMPTAGSPRTQTLRFRVQNNGTNTIPPPSVLNDMTNLGVSELCRRLLDSYPLALERSTQILDEFCRRLNGPSGLEPISIFNTILQILQSHGKATLQELITIECPYLGLHVKLLELTLELLEKDFQATLNSDNGVVYHLFGTNKGRAFIDSLLVQFVDATYSAVHPLPWGRKADSGVHVLTLIAPLRDILARLLPIVESVAHCVMFKLSVQQWRRRDESYAWISSVDPASWETLLTTGGILEGQREIRFAKFGGKLPRCEINALWEMITFCAEPGSQTENRSHTRWELLSTLLSRGAGVLAETESVSTPHQPGSEQITSCALELNTLSELLRTGVLNDLPSSDTFLVKVIERSLSIQADAESTNEELSLLASDEYRCDLKLLSRDIRKLWEASSLINKKGVQEFSAASSDFIHYFVPSSVNSLAYFNPSNKITTSCLRLLGFWMERVPAKRARWLRLLRAIDLLVNASRAAALKNSSETKPTTTPSTPTVFRFQSLVYSEAAAYISTISAAVCAFRWSSTADDKPKAFSEGLCRSVWLSVADDELQAKQERIFNGRGQPQDSTYNGHAVTVCAASKVMALLAFLHLGIPFWECSTEAMFSKVSLDLIQGVESDNNALKFLFSSLLATMDCLNDLLFQQSSFAFTEEKGSASSTEIVVSLSRISWQIGIFLFRAGNLATMENASTSTEIKSAVAIFSKSFFPMACPILTRSLLSLAHIAMGGKEVDSCFRSCLSVVRSCIRVLLAAAPNSVQAVGITVPTAQAVSVTIPTHPPTISGGEDEFFTGIDDDALACLDLEEQGGTLVEYTESLRVARLLTDSFKRLIDSSKPSSRFAISRRCQDASWLVPSVQGRLLVARQLGAICSCIAAVSVVSDSIHDTVDMMVPSAETDPGDDLWKAHVTQCLSSEITLLSKECPRLMDLVAGNWAQYASNLVQALLDATTLERFPSCNLQRIRTNGDGECYRSEKRRLLRINAQFEQTCNPNEVSVPRIRKDEENDTPGAVYNGRFVWAFCRALGEIIHLTEGSSERTDVGTALLDADCDLTRRPGSFFNGASLESECMKRLQQFRTVVSVVAANDVLPCFGFQSVSWLIIKTSLSQLLRVSQGLSYLDRAVQSDDNDVHDIWKRPKLKELMTCFAEVSVTLLIWILRINATALQKIPNSELEFICNVFLSPTLSVNDLDVCDAVRYVVCLASGGDRQRSPLNLLSSRLPSVEYLRACLRRAILRRGKQLISYMATQYQLGMWSSVSDIFRIFITAGVSGSDEIAGFDAQQVLFLVCSSFGDANNISSQLDRINDQSPLEGAIDEYLEFVELEQAEQLRQSEALCRLKYEKAIRDFLIPRIDRAHANVVKKKPCIHLLSLLLQLHPERFPSGCLEASLVCSITKCLWRCLRLSLEVDVDDDILSAVFEGGKALLTLPASAVEGIDHEDFDVDSVCQWSHEVSNARVADSLQELQAHYIWSFFVCLREIGESIVDPSSDADVKLLGVRVVVDKMVDASVEDTEQSNLDSVSMSIINLVQNERRVFPEKENEPNITNVYAKNVSRSSGPSRLTRTTKNDSLGGKIWKPKTTTRRKVKEFLTEVIRLS